MNFFGNMKIGMRLGVAFAAVLGLLTLTTVVAIVNMARLHHGTEVIVDVEYAKTKLQTTALDNARGSIARVVQVASDEDAARVAQARTRLDSNIKAYKAALSQLEPMLTRPEAKRLLAAAKESGAHYEAQVGKVLAAVSAAQPEEARKLAFGDTYTAMHAFTGDLRALLDFGQKLVEDTGVESDKTYAHARNLMIGLGIAAAALATLLAMLVTRSITRPISEAVKVAETVASGDLGSHIEVRSKDEIGQLMAALKHMNSQLLILVGNVRNAADSIATGSAQIATGNADLSQRTEEQASNLQQTAASMEQLTSTVKQNSDTAREATQLASHASTVASEGGAVVDKVVATMQNITASSSKIADIIGVIDGIAFQTNILALNAAVEAARAGEQGRGFAVVASEVRSLAQRSAGAAKEIKDLILHSVASVHTGAQQVQQAGDTMVRVVGNAHEVSQLIEDITRSATEQSHGIAEINVAVSELDTVTQQNASLVEQSSLATRDLLAQAERLRQVVGVFRLAA